MPVHARLGIAAVEVRHAATAVRVPDHRGPPEDDEPTLVPVGGELLGVRLQPLEVAEGERALEEVLLREALVDLLALGEGVGLLGRVEPELHVARVLGAGDLEVRGQPLLHPLGVEEVGLPELELAAKDIAMAPKGFSFR